MKRPSTRLALVTALMAITACSDTGQDPLAPSAEPESQASMSPASVGAMIGEVMPGATLIVPTNKWLEVSGSAAVTSPSGVTVLIEDFADPLGEWRDRFLGVHSNLNNYYYQYNSCWGPISGGECRGNNWDGLWVADLDNSSNNSYIRFDDDFAASLSYLQLDIGNHGSVNLVIYDQDMNVLLSTPVPLGCSNCSYGNPGGNIYHTFSASSTNGIGGFDLTGCVEGCTGIDNVIVHQGAAPPPDSDGDGVPDDEDAFPNDPNEWADSDGDGVGDNGDAFPNDPNEWADSDGDGVGDNGDAFPNDPNEWADSDGDGVGDNGDAFPNSDLSAVVSIGGCSTGVANHLFADGSTFNDLIAAAAGSARNHGQFVSAVTQMADGWKKAGLISGKDKGSITSCVASGR